MGVARNDVISTGNYYYHSPDKLTPSNTPEFILLDKLTPSDRPQFILLNKLTPSNTPEFILLDKLTASITPEFIKLYNSIPSSIFEVNVKTF